VTALESNGIFLIGRGVVIDGHGRDYTASRRIPSWLTEFANKYENSGLGFLRYSVVYLQEIGGGT